MADGEVRDRGGSGKVHVSPRLVGVVVIVIVLLAFVLDNTGKVRIGFVFTHADVGLIWVLLLTLLLGVVADRLWLRRRAGRDRGDGASPPRR